MSPERAEDAATILKSTDYVYGEHMTVDEVAMLRGLNRASVYRHISEAKERGVIKTDLDSAAAFDITRTNSKLEIGLAQAFPYLQWAEVVDLPHEYVRDEPFSYDRNAIIQRALGRTASYELPKLISDNDRVGLGGGRALTGVADALANKNTLHARTDLTFHSLAGGTPALPTRIDLRTGSADEVTMAIGARVFQGSNLSGKILLAGLPPYAESPTAYRPKKSGVIYTKSHAILFDPQHWQGAPQLEVAIFGIGNPTLPLPRNIFDDPFTMPKAAMDNAHGAWWNMKRYLETITRRIAETPDLQNYSPFLEILNHFAVVTPPNIYNHPRLQPVLERLTEHVDNLNAYAIGLRLEQLRRIPVRIAIAGGVKKSYQVFTALQEGLVSHLVTDQATAVRVLELKRVANVA